MAAGYHDIKVIDHITPDVTDGGIADSRAKMEAILQAAADHASCLVLEHRSALVNIADALCDQDEITGEQISMLLTASFAP